MAKVFLSSDLQRYTGGVSELDVAAGNYLELVAELRERFPGLPEDVIHKQSLAIDGMLIHTPMLESFHRDSDLVFVARIAGG